MEKIEQVTNEMSNSISGKGSNDVFQLIHFSEKNGKNSDDLSEK